MSSIILLDQFPLPPQSNNLFSNFRGRRIKTREYRAFELEVEEWASSRDVELEDAALVVREKMSIKMLLRIDIAICVPGFAPPAKPERTPKGKRLGPPATPGLWSKKDGSWRKWDASNRIKAAHDALCPLLGVDDSRVTVGLAEKVLIDDDERRCLLIRLSFHEFRTRSQVIEQFINERP